MRVCLLSRSLYPLIGGSETYVYAIGERLARMGHEVVVVTSTLPAHYTPYHAYPFRVIRVAGLSEFNSAQAPLSTLIPLFEVLSSVRPDVIHVQNVLLGIALTLIAESLPGSPGIVFTDHNTPIPRDRRWISGVNCYEVELALGRFLFQRGVYDLALAPSRWFYTWALECGAPRGKLLLVRHGIDVGRFSPGPVNPVIRQRLCSDANAFVLLAPGRMVRRKGTRPILEALSDPLLAGRNVQLAITTSQNTSEPDFLAEVRALVASTELNGRVTFLVDAFTPEEMPDVYRAADAVMLLSSAEGFGLVGIEALASGIPLVASPSTGIDEYLRHDVTGLAVGCSSSVEIAQAVARLMDQPLLRRFLAKNGRTVAVEEFDQTVMIREVERAYGSVLPASRRSPRLKRNVISVNGVRALFASRQRR